MAITKTGNLYALGAKALRATSKEMFSPLNMGFAAMGLAQGDSVGSVAGSMLGGAAGTAIGTKVGGKRFGGGLFGLGSMGSMAGFSVGSSLGSRVPLWQRKHPGVQTQAVE